MGVMGFVPFTVHASPKNIISVQPLNVGLDSPKGLDHIICVATSMTYTAIVLSYTAFYLVTSIATIAASYFIR